MAKFKGVRYKCPQCPDEYYLMSTHGHPSEYVQLGEWAATHTHADRLTRTVLKFSVSRV